MNIYVGNLSRDVTEDQLREVFAACGQVESVNLIKDRFSGESRGFGFVEMPSKEEGLNAIKEVDGKEISGRVIKVNEAHSRPKGRNGGGGGQRRGGFGGGGGGGGGGRDRSRGPRRY